MVSACLTNVDEYIDGSDGLLNLENHFPFTTIRNLRRSLICPFIHTVSVGRQVLVHRNVILLFVLYIHNGVFAYLEKRIVSMVPATWSPTWNWNHRQINSSVLCRNPVGDYIAARSDNSKQNIGGNSNINRTVSDNRTVSVS